MCICTLFLTCSVIKFVILTMVCRSKSFLRAYVTYYVYSTLNKSSMSMSISRYWNEVLKMNIRKGFTKYWKSETTRVRGFSG